MWELDGWDGLVANFAHELVGAGAQDPSLAEWWAVAASLRRGGVDRIVVPEPWTRPIDALVADGGAGRRVRPRAGHRAAGGVARAAGRGPRPGGGRLGRGGRRVGGRLPGGDGSRHRGDPPVGPARLGHVGRRRAGVAGGGRRHRPAGRVAQGAPRPRRRPGSARCSPTPRWPRCGSAASPRRPTACRSIRCSAGRAGHPAPPGPTGSPGGEDLVVVRVLHHAQHVAERVDDRCRHEAFAPGRRLVVRRGPNRQQAVERAPATSSTAQ